MRICAHAGCRQVNFWYCPIPSAAAHCWMHAHVALHATGYAQAAIIGQVNAQSAAIEPVILKL